MSGRKVVGKITLYGDEEEEAVDDSVRFGTVLIIFTLGYLMPTGIRINKKQPIYSNAKCFLINVLSGWLIIPWIIQLYRAIRSEDEPKLDPEQERLGRWLFWGQYLFFLFPSAFGRK
jgi:hypothetical protein